MNLKLGTAAVLASGSARSSTPNPIRFSVSQLAYIQVFGRVRNIVYMFQAFFSKVVHTMPAHLLYSGSLTFITNEG